MDGYRLGNAPFCPPLQAPAYELKWPNPNGFSANDIETIHDWTTVAFCAHAMGNIAGFVEHVSPTVTLLQPTGPVQPPAAENRLSDAIDGPPSHTGAAASPPSPAPPSYRLADLWYAFRVPFGVSIPLEYPVQLSQMRHPDSEVFYTPQLSGFHLTFGDETANEGKSDFAWFAMDKPEMRRPFFEQMELIMASPEFAPLATATSSDLTVGSWFAVLWQPIHVKNHVQTNSAGAFLCFYAVNPPLTQAGSQYTGVESYFRADRLSVQKPMWQLKRQTTSVEIVDTSSQFPSAPVGSARSATPPTAISSRLESPAAGVAILPITGGFQPHSLEAIRVPIFGIVPSRFRVDVWFRATNDPSRRCSYSGPLFLFAAAMQLLSYEQVNNPFWTDEFRLIDAHFMTRHERTMLDFQAMYSG